MSRVIFDKDFEVGIWVATRIPAVQTVERFGDFAAFAFASDDLSEIYAGAVYHNYRFHDIELSFAADNPRWATKGNIRITLAYPFEQLGVARITTVVGRKNKRVRRLLEGVGFKLEGVARKGLDGIEDSFIFGIIRKDANRWLKGKEYGRKRIERTDASRPN